MFKQLLQFFILFFILFTVAYVVHLAIVERYIHEINQDVVQFSYVFNGIYTTVIIGLIILLSKRLKDHLGLIFLAGSFLKIALFLGIAKWVGIDMNKSVFVDFFVAYLICMVIEVFIVAKILNNDN